MVKYININVMVMVKYININVMVMVKYIVYTSNTFLSMQVGNNE